MSASRLERRVQILLDEARYERVAREAAASRRSVGAVIREANDQRFPVKVDLQANAAQVLLDLTEQSTGTAPEPDWAEVKGALESDLEARFP